MSLASRYYHASLTYAKRHLSQLDPDYYPLPIQIQVMQIKDRSDRKGRDILSPRKEAAKRKNELVIQTFLCSFRDIICNISYVTVTIVRSEKRRRRSGEGGKTKEARKIICTRTCELRLTDSSKPEDTFRADNRTRNASTMPRKAWREHREFAIVRGGTGTWPGVRVQKEAPRGPFAHCRSYAPDRPLSISFFPPFFDPSVRPSVRLALLRIRPIDRADWSLRVHHRTKQCLTTTEMDL